MQRFFTTDAVTSLEDVRKRLADPIKHWRKGYSAFELADKWISADDFPQAVRQVLDAYPLFWGARLIEAFFERKVGGTMTQSTGPNRIINQIKLAIRRTGAIQKSSSTVSSNISSGLKKRLEDRIIKSSTVRT